MGFLKSCFDYPCPYDPWAVDARPPKYHVSRIVHPEEVAEKDQLCEKPPVYTEQAAPASSSGLAKSPSPCSLRRYQFACPACRYRYLRQNFTKWVLAQRKPYSAVTVQIDRLTSEQYEEDDMGGIIDLVDVIRIQDSGPTEAARAIRKKLKYGNVHRQIRALTILDGLIQNAGSRFQRAFADEPLLERLRMLPQDSVVDPQVKQKCKVLFVQWANAYKNTPGLERIASLYKELPNTKRASAQPARSKVLRETEPVDSDSEPAHDPFSAGHSRSSSSNMFSSPGTSSRPVTLGQTSPFTSSKLSKGKKDKSVKPFNLAKEKDNMTNAIAQSSIASTNLLNGLQLINRETERVSENPEVVRRFETCKTLRRQVLGYIQNVESENWIGSLVNANDELVKALTAYEIMDKSVDDDSDSDAWDQAGGAPHGHGHGHTTHHPPGSGVTSTTANQLAGLSLEAAPTKPPRPMNIAMPPQPTFKASKPAEDEEEDDDPFGDSNAAPTPAAERPGMTWREV